MFKSSSFGVLIVMLMGSSLVVGCSSSSQEDDSSNNNNGGGGNVAGSSADVVGVTDLGALEAAFGLEKDPNRERSQEKLEAGQCWQRLKGPNASAAADWEFRRYKNGAAFFATESATRPASGDKRPVACVDVDLSGGIGGGETLAFDGFALDAAIRFKLGKPSGYDAGAGQVYFAFSEGALKVRYPDNFCGLTMSPENVPRDSVEFNPAPLAFHDAYWSCKDSGKDDATCSTEAHHACVAAAKTDIAKNEVVDRPVALGAYVVEMTDRNVNPEVAMLAYKYAWKKATDDDVFSMGDDPVGRFVSAEEPKIGANGARMDTARFERLDIHDVVINVEGGGGAQENLYITPKSSDSKVIESAVASCSRPMKVDGQISFPIGSFTCKGL